MVWRETGLSGKSDVLRLGRNVTESAPWQIKNVEACNYRNSRVAMFCAAFTILDRCSRDRSPRRRQTRWIYFTMVRVDKYIRTTGYSRSRLGSESLLNACSAWKNAKSQRCIISGFWMETRVETRNLNVESMFRSWSIWTDISVPLIVSGIVKGYYDRSEWSCQVFPIFNSCKWFFYCIWCHASLILLIHAWYKNEGK